MSVSSLEQEKRLVLERIDGHRRLMEAQRAELRRAVAPFASARSYVSRALPWVRPAAKLLRAGGPGSKVTLGAVVRIGLVAALLLPLLRSTRDRRHE